MNITDEQEGIERFRKIANEVPEHTIEETLEAMNSKPSLQMRL